jgi:hypothetical protein
MRKYLQQERIIPTAKGTNTQSLSYGWPNTSLGGEAAIDRSAITPVSIGFAISVRTETAGAISNAQ